MFPNIEGYENYHIIQSTQTNEVNINSFIELGWDLIGVLNLKEIKFIQLGWSSAKGDPIYP